MIIARLRHYVPEHQRGWYIYAQRRTYVYNSQLHHTLNLPPFGFVLSRQPPVPETLDNPTALTTDRTATTSLLALKAGLLKYVATIREDANKQMNRRCDNTGATIIAKFAKRHCLLPQDSISTSTSYRWLYLQHSVWRPSLTICWCPLRQDSIADEDHRRWRCNSEYFTDQMS